MTTALEGGEGSASHPGRSLPPGKTRYPLYRRLDGPQGRSGQMRKISPLPGFNPQTVQPVASRYTDYATWPTYIMRQSSKFWKSALFPIQRRPYPRSSLRLTWYSHQHSHKTYAYSIKGFGMLPPIPCHVRYYTWHWQHMLLFPRKTALAILPTEWGTTVKAMPFVTCQNSSHFNIDRQVLKRTDRESWRTMGHVDEYSISPFCFPFGRQNWKIAVTLSAWKKISIVLFYVFVIYL